MSNGEQGEKTVALGENFAHSQWRDYLGHREEIVSCDDQGNGQFFCNGGSLSVWVVQ